MNGLHLAQTVKLYYLRKNHYAIMKSKKSFFNCSIVLLFILFTSTYLKADVGITQATGGTNINRQKAVGGCAPAYTTLGTIIINEGVNDDIPMSVTNATFVLSTPIGWQFNNVGAASISTAGDLTALTITSFTATTITFQYSTNGNPKAIDGISISNLQVQATSTASANGNIYCTSMSTAIAGITPGAAGTNFGSLSLATATPTITTQPTSLTRTDCADQNASFTVAATGISALSYQWQKNGVDVVDGGAISGATSATLTITGVVMSDAANYTCIVTDCSGSTTTAIATLTVNACPPPTYCTSGATSTADTDIRNVTLAGFSSTLNNTSPTLCQMYTDYTGLAAADLVPGASYTVNISQGSCSGFDYSFYYNVWIDFNNDADFNDAGEMLTTGTVLTATYNTPIPINFTVPGGADLGLTRMRVIISEVNTATDPCATTFTYGETEDYTVNIITPGPMVFSSCTTTQTVTNNISKCSTDQQIIGIEVVTTGSTAPLTLTQLQINMNGSTIPGTNTNDVSLIQVFYTGTSSTFSAINPFDGAGTAVAAGTISIGGSQVLAPGTNYFWVAYDINLGTATTNNLLDAQCTQITVAAVNHTPTVTSPAGSRTIVVCDPAPGGVSAGLETWVRADMGITGGTPVSAWENQKTTGTNVLVHGAPNLNTSATTYNYNPYVEFTAPASTLSNGWGPDRQFLHLEGFSDLDGINYRSLFFAFELEDLSRIHTHIATVDGVTYSFPANGTFHGDENAGVASIIQEAYDINDFGTSAAAGTWRRNGLSIASNSVHSSVKHVLSANCQTGGSTTLNTFLGGQIDQFDPNAFAGHPRDWRGPCAEIIGYSSSMTAIERQKIDSYLALKYGMTLTFDYLNTTAATIFSITAPYNNNIIGIGRDDAEALTQKQSHNDDDTVRVYISSLVGTNLANTGVFTNDISYVVTGANTGKMCATTASNAEMPLGLTNCLLYSRLEREWKVTRTNMAQAFNMDFKLAPCGAPTLVNVAHLRLLVDDDGNFANGGTQCYYNGDGTGVVISYSNPTITVTGINTTHIPNNSTRFITIASIDVITPLPIELLHFDAKAGSARTVDVTWTTATEIDNDYFIVEKSTNGASWSQLGTVPGAGNSTETIDYYLEDAQPVLGNNYYRLKQVDYNGTIKTSDIRLVIFNGHGGIGIYPNPATNKFIVTLENIEASELTFYDAMGKLVQLPIIASSKDALEFSVENIAEGIYYIKVDNGMESSTLKVIVQK